MHIRETHTDTHDTVGVGHTHYKRKHNTRPEKASVLTPTPLTTAV